MLINPACPVVLAACGHAEADQHKVAKTSSAQRER